MRKIDSQIHAPVRIDPAYAAQKRAVESQRLASAAKLVARMTKVAAAKKNTVVR